MIHSLDSFDFLSTDLGIHSTLFHSILIHSVIYFDSRMYSIADPLINPMAIYMICLSLNASVTCE